MSTTFSEFRDYTNGVPDRSFTIQMPSETFREVKCLPMKYYFVVEGTKRVQDIAYMNKRITDLFYCTKERNPARIS